MTPIVHHGDCLDALHQLPDSSIDAVVTDPPYSLTFMGRDWDRHASPGEFQQWCQAWAAECLRVLKPGGHFLAFGGTRTYHRLTSGIEDAGFEIRDSIHWIYGSGFPKSLDVSKAIDRAAGAEREVVGRGQYADRGRSPAAQQWQGYGTALKPAHEPIVVARKPLAGTVAQTVLAHGTGALNIDGCRVEGAPRPEMVRTSTVVAASSMSGTSTGATSSGAITTAGRWPSNIVLTHAPGCVETGTRRVRTGTAVKRNRHGQAQGDSSWSLPGAPRDDATHADADGLETIPAFDCVLGCPVAEMDQQSGTSKSPPVGSVARTQGGNTIGTFAHAGREASSNGHGDSGGASRFFPVFRYQAKAPSSERPKVDGVAAHPTVKPLALMRWLVRLVTPPGGTVLDPFAGSGTTIEAALLEGVQPIGIEREADYLPMIQARIHRVPQQQRSA